VLQVGHLAKYIRSTLKILKCDAVEGRSRSFRSNYEEWRVLRRV